MPARVAASAVFALAASGCASLVAPSAGFQAGVVGEAPGAPVVSSERDASGVARTAAAPTLTDVLEAQCAPDFAFARGAAGESDEGLCTGDFAAPFRAAFQKGADLYAARLDVEQTKAEISAVQRDLWTARGEAKTLEARASSIGASPDARRALKAERDLRSAEAARLDRELNRLQTKLAAAQASVEARSVARGEEATAAPAERPVLTPVSY